LALVSVVVVPHDTHTSNEATAATARRVRPIADLNPNVE